MAEEQQRDNQVRANLLSEQEARRLKLLALREKGIDPYPNRVQRTNTIIDVLEHFHEWQTDERDVTLTGRIRLMREMGKAAFAQIEDGTGRMQIYFRINDIGEDAYKTLKLLDIGDFVQVRGFLFITRTGERTLHVRVYEIGRDFRNEGIDRSHNPEFTMMECYQAYADYNDIMRLVEEMICFIAQGVKGSARITYRGTEIDLTPPWNRIRLLDAIEEFTGIDVDLYPDKERLATAMREHGYEADPNLGRGRLIDDLKGIMFRKGNVALRQALFLTDYPLDVSPLAKPHTEFPGLVERFQPFVGGLELGNAFTELNDPLDQRARFEDQMRQRAQGDEEAQVLDEDFLEALEVGMPPTGGLGLGVDRLVMLLADQESIRDVILFPTMRKTVEEQ